MSDRKLTLFELHFDGGFQIGPKTIGGDETTEELEGEDVEEATEIAIEDGEMGDAEGGRRILPRVAALAFLLGLALGARRLMGRRDGSQTTLDDEFETQADGDDIDVEA